MAMREWRENLGLSLAAMASRLRAANAKVVSRWEKREAVPRPDTMIRIWVESNGQVDPNSFYKLPPLGESPAPAAPSSEAAER